MKQRKIVKSKKPGHRKSSPNEAEIDARVGRKLKELRNGIGMTQSELADQTGITFQQIQKYENGQNRITVSRAVTICSALGVKLATLLEVAVNDDAVEEMPRLLSPSAMRALREWSPHRRRWLSHFILGLEEKND